MQSSDLRHRYDQERVDRFKIVARIAMGYYSMPLYILFWIADWFYVPQHKWKFLAVRCLIIPYSLISNTVIQRAKTRRQIEILCSSITLANALPIIWMVYMSGDGNSPYYAGLLMVASGMGNFFPWTWKYFIIQMLLIFIPYYVMAIFLTSTVSLGGMVLNSFFIIGIIVIASVIRFFGEGLVVKEFFQRISRERELKSRDRIIKRQTAQEIRLERLSRQFSPQVIASIKSGKLEVDRAPRSSEIAALVVDISGYTKACRRLSASSVQYILNNFYKICIQRLFKYDITFDKTMGDAVLGFSNEPEPHRDYVQRVVQAAVEILSEIEKMGSRFQEIWQEPFKVKVGIAVGRADVGFHGDEGSPKTYTASGEVMNLTARLSDCADSGEILVTEKAAEILINEGNPQWNVFHLENAGMRTLDGYEDVPQQLFKVTSKDRVSNTLVDVDCPTCPRGHGQLHLDENINGIFIFKCRVCLYEAGNDVFGSDQKALKKVS